MINIMYLVLMALLALNVSAEVMNAFQTLDEGNKNSIATVNDQVDETVKGLNTLLEDGSKEKYRVIQPAIAEVRSKVAEFNSYVNELRDEIIDKSGNNNGEIDDEDYKDDHGMRTVRGKKNKDVTTRVLVLGEDGVVGGTPGKGEELKAKIAETRLALIASYKNLLDQYGKTPFGLSETQIAADLLSVGENMPFKVDDDAWKAADRDSWSEFKFGHMPVAAVLPLMSQMQSDLKVSEANLVNAMASYAGGRTIEFDKFFPVFAADRSYVIGGEQIKAKVSVGSYSSSLDPANIDLRVNGQKLRVNADGTADFSITGSGSGQKTLTTSVRVKNPLTGDIEEGKGTFTYEVGQRSVAVSADQMNVFYIGVDNPITVSAAGVPSSSVRVNVSGNASKKSGSGSKFIVKGTKPGKANVNVTADGQSLGSFEFRVKRIPDPFPKIGGSKGGSMASNAFKVQKGLYAELEGFDFDARCNVVGYELVHVPQRKDAQVNTNAAGPFNARSKRMISAARPGDTYYAQNIRAKCPGDGASRQLGTIVFQIK